MEEKKESKERGYKEFHGAGLEDQTRKHEISIEKGAKTGAYQSKENKDEDLEREGARIWKENKEQTMKEGGKEPGKSPWKK